MAALAWCPRSGKTPLHCNVLGHPADVIAGVLLLLLIYDRNIATHESNLQLLGFWAQFSLYDLGRVQHRFSMDIRALKRHRSSRHVENTKAGKKDAEDEAGFEENYRWF
ncbi:hypothetical protein BC939DRAFT_481575 [Gamsiella multidivaricata]|uniref:uncharacterized protein n=1 Tax=Gamsiella multidivaricata TaxID=101098 RepID=UPI00221F5ADB|nr:uncharacterized protein BC939DRAFT_481575 [Gamsiella multidivaricata]KAI7816962.1 hypothetical protein BC939DRAFT_481575 [Gamsiella multidivaricata]